MESGRDWLPRIDDSKNLVGFQWITFQIPTNRMMILMFHTYHLMDWVTQPRTSGSVDIALHIIYDVSTCSPQAKHYCHIYPHVFCTWLSKLFVFKAIQHLPDDFRMFHHWMNYHRSMIYIYILIKWHTVFSKLYICICVYIYIWAGMLLCTICIYWYHWKGIWFCKL